MIELKAFRLVDGHDNEPRIRQGRGVEIGERYFECLEVNPGQALRFN